jgi:uncharacterized membrane protein
MLALYDPLMPLGLYVGCLLANVLGGLGLPDIIFGPILTLAAGYATWATRKLPVIPFIPPILFNALGVAGSGFWATLVNWAALHPYWAMVLSIGIGQTISVVVFGLLFMKMWRMSGSDHFSK